MELCFPAHGHAHLLLHTNESNDVMYFEIITYKRILRPYDIEGGRYEVALGISNDPFNCVTPMDSIIGSCGINSINDLSSIGQVYVYPNPATNELTIRVENDETDNFQWLEVYSSSGARITRLKITPSQSLVNVAFLPPGIYLIRLIDDDGKSASGKFVKH